MAISPMSDNLNIIAALADKPNATDGLSAAQLKAKFDQGPGLIKAYINSTIVPAIDSDQLGPVTRQAAINGGFPINQRVVSGTVTLAAGAYGHDRWKAGASGCTYTFATANNVTTITISAGSLVQVIEGINLYSGTYTLSWTGTAQGKIGSGSYSASGVTGTIIGGTNTNIEFNAGTLSQVQFNAGGLALPFQPRSFADELAMCKRYYEVVDRGLFGRGYNTTTVDYIVKFTAIKRTVPIPVILKAAHAYFALGGAAGTTSGSTISGSNLSENGGTVSLTGYSSSSGAIYTINDTRVIGFDSEL